MPDRASQSIFRQSVHFRRGFPFHCTYGGTVVYLGKILRPCRGLHKEDVSMLFVCYPNCSTCKKARAFLESRNAAFTVRDIKTDRPTEEELRLWQAQSGLPLKKFFNTSGQQYKALGLKDRLPAMSEDEQFALLATDGMLVKRPILVTDDGKVLVGFREAEWDAAL